MSIRGPNAIDKLVARRIRHARRLSGLTQSEVGRALGITFQQIQKYENGRNRVSAGTLAQIAQLLNYPIGYFFKDLDRTR
jgi:transcriptional regulator with XRE-family HTH domain